MELLIQLARHRRWIAAGGAVLAYVAWLRLSYDAEHDPAGLGNSFLGLPIRHDTLGALCGTAATVLLGLAGFWWPSRLNRRPRAVQGTALAGMVSGVLGWFYIGQNRHYHPQTLNWPLTHFLSFPQERTFGTACAIIAVLSLVVLGVTMASRRRTKHPKALHDS